MIENLNYKDIAIRQLNLSIELYLNKGDLICAITLAGAAEEILGRLVQKTGQTSALEIRVQSAIDFYQAIFPHRPLPKKSYIVEIKNRARNMMKHFKDDIPQEMNLDYNAGLLIKRAIENYCLLYGIPTPLMRKFQEERLNRIQNSNGL